MQLHEESEGKAMNDEKNDNNQTDKAQPKIEKKDKWWVKITITGIIAVIVTIGGLVSNIDKIMDFYEKRISKKAETKVSAKLEPKSIVEGCELLNVKIFPVFPYYLVNTYNKAPDNDYIYWALITGKNTCNTRLLIKMWFKPDTLKAIVNKEEFYSTIESGNEINKKANPELKIISKADENFNLSADWKIFSTSDNKEVKIKQGDDRILVIADNTMYWALKNSDGKPVDSGFLLASLSAWSILPKKPPQELGDRATRYLGQGNNPGEWMKNCYTDLFRSAGPVIVHSYEDPWPPRGEGGKSQQRIRTSEMILAGKKADSLEVALLIAALKNAVAEDLHFRLALFALPLNSQKDIGVKRFLLAWSPEGGEWRAIDLTEPNKLDFDLNVKQASEILAGILQTQREKILPLLDKKGVFYDDKQTLAQQTLLAVDFGIAPEYFYVAGLTRE